MTTPVYNVDGMEGSTVTLRVQVQEPDGTVADLSGYTGSIQVRSGPLSDEILASGEVTIADGVVTAVIAAGDTLEWSYGFYDVRITSDAGTVEYVLRGSIALRPSVTPS